ncbi:hypothetical protein VY86_05880 [Photorhabdus thracensis]|uniref:Uncharacterized protein n=1 Tax=Photorhabdus thracensis TaxID=230089 RepID=A0A0F7LLK4_9GAMM|nr:hypothetical protein VY86_05880 [Photorhabdus thracensis]
MWPQPPVNIQFPQQGIDELKAAKLVISAQSDLSSMRATANDVGIFAFSRVGNSHRIVDRTVIQAALIRIGIYIDD